MQKRTKQELREVHKYWKGKTSSELATSYMDPEAIKAIEHNIFTPGNYFYNGVGHVTVKYGEVLAIGYKGIIDKAQAELDKCQVGDANYVTKSHFLNAVILSCQAAIEYAEDMQNSHPRWQQSVQIRSVNRNFCRFQKTAAVYRRTELQASMKPASLSGLYSS